MVQAFALTRNEPFSSRKEDMCTSLVWPAPQKITRAPPWCNLPILESFVSLRLSTPSNNPPEVKLHSSCQRTPTAHCCHPGGTSSSLGHPQFTCFWCFYGACGSSASRPLTLFLAILKFLHCHTSPPIDAHHLPLHEPGKCPPHNASVDVKVDQRVPDIVRHGLRRIKAMGMCLAITGVDNA
jgi:hypothetical protein